QRRRDISALDGAQPAAPGSARVVGRTLTEAHGSPDRVQSAWPVETCPGRPVRYTVPADTWRAYFENARQCALAPSFAPPPRFTRNALPCPPLPNRRPRPPVSAPKNSTCWPGRPTL